MTGRAILDALIEGEEDPEVLADLAHGSLRRKRGLLAETVPGLIRDHHRFLLRDLLDGIDHLARRIDGLDIRVEEATRPFSAALALLQTMPGVRPLSARAILAEIGDDMTRFPTARHFASWARVRPGNYESAGKRRPVSTGRGNAWLRDALSQVAWGAARTKHSCYRALYYRQPPPGRTEEGDRGGPARDPHGDLAHDVDGHRSRGSRARPLPTMRQGTPGAQPGQTAREARRAGPGEGGGRIAGRTSSPHPVLEARLRY